MTSGCRRVGSCPTGARLSIVRSDTLTVLSNWLHRLRRRAERSTNGHVRPADPAPDPEAVATAVLRAEEEREIAPGKVVHRLNYAGLDLRLDRDMLGDYRVTVNEGAKRLYSFTLRGAAGDADALREAYAEIFRFLEGDRRVADLPRTDHLTGHFYGP